MTPKKSILFVGEGVSLAHVSRPLVLAQSMDPQQYDIHFACDRRYKSFISSVPHIRYWPLRSITPEAFIKGNDQGGYVYQKKDIESYIAEELALFEKILPSCIIGDFRYTLAISAELSRITYATLSNIHWSPYRVLEFDPDPPPPPYTKPPINARIWRRLCKLVPWMQDASIENTNNTDNANSIRQKYGLSPVDSYFHLLTRGDYTLYTDPPDFIQTEPLPSHHLFLGPILWSPVIRKPTWWQTWDTTLPLIYVTLGSTGEAKRLPEILQVLANLPVTIVVATAGRVQLRNMPQNVYVADYLPGMEISQLASVVVCSGGSATAYQALSQGTPVVGIWSNRDQYLTMMVIEHAGAGLGCHASRFDSQTMHHIISTVLHDSLYRDRAGEIAKKFKSYDACQRFQQFIHNTPALTS